MDHEIRATPSMQSRMPHYLSCEANLGCYGPMTKSRNILLSTFGSYGDIHPYMALALELQRRGHHPVIATSELYREKISASGFEFVPVRPHIPPPQEQDAEMMEKVMHPSTGSRFL